MLGETPAQHAVIRNLSILRYRGIEDLEWRPAPGLNLIVGGGDVGKSTVLDAIALLLNPSNAAALSEVDYWRRESGSAFIIEGVISLPSTSDIGSHSTFMWPWHWDGTEAVQPVAPDGSSDIPAATDPVYRLRVSGTADMELVWEVVQPDGSTAPLSAGIRRQIGLVRLSADERNDRDLRLVFGSALDRLLGDPALRTRIAKQVSEQDLAVPLGEAGAKKLSDLDVRLANAALPTGTKLGLTSSQGLSIGALIGLLADKDGVMLPLASWGAGTRRMAALEIASSTQSESKITVVDEIERGLEPYRLRQLVKVLRTDFGQSFVTTHSPIAVACGARGHLWYFDSVGKIGELPGLHVKVQQHRDPETFLSKLAVIAEGETEVGFLKEVLIRAFSGAHEDHGVRVCLGQGNVQTLNLLEALGKSGLAFSALVDDEGTHQGRWRSVKDAMGDRLLQWPSACTEEAVIAKIDETKIVELFKDSDGDFIGTRLRTVADRLGIEEKAYDGLCAAASAQGKCIRDYAIAAAKGDPTGAPEGAEKEWKSHAKSWFKSELGGAELARKMFSLGAWTALSPTAMPLVNAILASVGQATLSSLPDE